MPLLTVNNLKTTPVPLQDPSGQSSFSVSVKASGTLSVAISDDTFAAIEPALKSLTTRGDITWTIADDPNSKADNSLSETAPQPLSGAGAVNVTTRTTLLTSTGAAQAITLADGTRAGQRKTLIHAVDGGSMVLTPAHPGVIATVVFTALRDWAELEWSGTVWNVVAFGGCTFT